jgi:acetyl esterase/lipase
MWAGRIFRSVVALAIVLLLGATVLAVRQAHATELRNSAAVAHNEAVTARIDELVGGRYRDHIFNDVNVTHDVNYDGSHSLDVYTPAGDNDQVRGALVWFHPGGFTEGDKSKEADLATDMARRGYVVFVADYTLTNYPWFDMDARIAAANVAHLEAQAAIMFVRAHATEYGIDPSLIFAGGYSAGAIITFDLNYGATTPAAKIDGGFAIAGYTNDIPQPGAAPMLDFHGSNDLLIPNALGQTACASAEHAGDQCTVKTFDGQGHEIGYSQRAAIEDQAATFLASLIAAAN